MRPKLHFAHEGSFVLETLVYVSIRDNACRLLQGIIWSLWAVVSVVKLYFRSSAAGVYQHSSRGKCHPCGSAANRSAGRGEQDAPADTRLCGYLLTPRWAQKGNAQHASVFEEEMF